MELSRVQPRDSRARDAHAFWGASSDAGAGAAARGIGGGHRVLRDAVVGGSSVADGIRDLYHPTRGIAGGAFLSAHVLLLSARRGRRKWECGWSRERQRRVVAEA